MIPARVLVEVELYRIAQTQKVRDKFAEIRASSGPAPLDGYVWLDKQEALWLATLNGMLDRALAENDR